MAETPFEPPGAALIGRRGRVAEEHIDAIERHIQFVRGHHGPGGRRSLPVIDLANLDQNGPVAMDLEERIHRD